MSQRPIRRFWRLGVLAMTLCYAFGLLAPGIARAVGRDLHLSHCMFDSLEGSADEHGTHMHDAAASSPTGLPVAHSHHDSDPAGPSKGRPHDCCGPACLTALPATAVNFPVPAMQSFAPATSIIAAFDGRGPDRFYKPPIVVRL